MSLELALCRRVADRDLGVVEEAHQSVPVLAVVAHGRGQEVRGQQRGLDGGEPLRELGGDRPNLRASMLQARGALEPIGPSLLLGDVHRGDERSALLGEHGLRGFRVAELATAVRVAAGLDHAPRRVDAIDRCEQIRCALDEAHERAHREGTARSARSRRMRSSGESRPNFWWMNHAS